MCEGSFSRVPFLWDCTSPTSKWYHIILAPFVETQTRRQMRESQYGKQLPRAQSSHRSPPHPIRPWMYSQPPPLQEVHQAERSNWLRDIPTFFDGWSKRVLPKRQREQLHYTLRPCLDVLHLLKGRATVLRHHITAPRERSVTKRPHKGGEETTHVNVPIEQMTDLHSRQSPCSMPSPKWESTKREKEVTIHKMIALIEAPRW